MQQSGAEEMASRSAAQTGDSASVPHPADREWRFLFSSTFPDWVWGLLLLVATLLAYQPAWNGKLIWDDAAHLTYPHLRSLHGLYRLWSEPGVTQQYYPMVSTVFWVEHRLWGDSTLGYHLINILLHVTSAFLLLKILRSFEIPAAGLAAAIFALHPIQVESVAWISELKNTFSGVCYFASALAYLHFDRTRKRDAYAGALALFAIGLMAKTVIATLPAALLVVFWWRRGKLSWRQDVAPLIPFLAAGMTAGYFTSWMEREFIGAEGVGYNFTLVERCLIAGRAVWFYLGKLFWPADLIFSYPRWKISQAVWWQYLFPAAAALLLGALWALRRRWRGPLAAMLFFIGTLFPALGFVNVFPFKYSFVADHFQYLASIGPIVAASVGLFAILRRIGERRAGWKNLLCAMLLVVLGVLTWRQSRMYSDIETLWRETLARNPDSWLAQNDLGSVLYAQGKVDEAIVRFRSSLEIRPDNAETENNLGAALSKKGRIDEAIAWFQKALIHRPDFAEAHSNLGGALLQKGQLDAALLEFQKAVAVRPDFPELHSSLGGALLQKGVWDGAAIEFEKTVELQPDNDQAFYNLGVALRQEGRGDESIIALEKAVAIRPDFVEAQNNLGNCLIQKGRLDEAIAHLKKALENQPDYAQSHFNLGIAFLRKGQTDQAIIEFQKLVALQSKSPEAFDSLANALLQKGRTDEAIAQFQNALAIRPDFANSRRNLGRIAWRLATSPNASERDGAKAVELARQTDRLAGHSDPTAAAILAAACAEVGDFSQAVTTARRALDLANHQNNTAMAAAIQTQINTYQAGSPFRDANPSW